MKLREPLCLFAVVQSQVRAKNLRPMHIMCTVSNVLQLCGLTAFLCSLLICSVIKYDTRKFWMPGITHSLRHRHTQCVDVKIKPNHSDAESHPTIDDIKHRLDISEHLLEFWRTLGQIHKAWLGVRGRVRRAYVFSPEKNWIYRLSGLTSGTGHQYVKACPIRGFRQYTRSALNFIQIRTLAAEL